jgi:two-component system response regulator YesN
VQKTVFKPARRVLLTVCRDYYRSFRLHAVPVDVAGHPLLPGRTFEQLPGLPPYNEALACCLQEALCWGEPYIFFRMSGVVSWIVGLVDRRELVGGIVGGEVLAYDGADKEALSALRHDGVPLDAARRYVARLRPWSSARIRDAASALSAAFYQISGWQPELLDENRRKAMQQRQIAEAMDAQRKLGAEASAHYPVDKERLLLSLIKAGDRNGARRVLNETLGVMFLSSPKLVILRARAIEMMGYLTRAAVEDNVEMEPLLEQNHQWMRKLIAARDFETLAHVLMQALDAFMDGIYSHSRGIGHPGLLRVLEYINQNFQRNLTLQEAAQAAGLSAFHVSRLLKRHTGRTFLQHLTQRRVRQAMQLLERTDQSCPEIAYATGFCDQSYFIKQFKRVAGVTPGRYRRDNLCRRRDTVAASAP